MQGDLNSLFFQEEHFSLKFLLMIAGSCQLVFLNREKSLFALGSVKGL